MVDVLNMVGEVAENDMKTTISQYPWKPNSDIWKMFKERTNTNINPLMFKEKMINAISHRIILE
jgi:hypothetical protein